MGKKFVHMRRSESPSSTNCCSVGIPGGINAGWHLHRAIELTVQYSFLQFCGDMSLVLAKLMFTNVVRLAMLANDRERRE